MRNRETIFRERERDRERETEREIETERERGPGLTQTDAQPARARASARQHPRPLPRGRAGGCSGCSARGVSKPGINDSDNDSVKDPDNDNEGRLLSGCSARGWASRAGNGPPGPGHLVLARHGCDLPPHPRPDDAAGAGAGGGMPGAEDADHLHGGPHVAWRNFGQEFNQTGVKGEGKSKVCNMRNRMGAPIVSAQVQYLLWREDRPHTARRVLVRLLIPGFIKTIAVVDVSVGVSRGLEKFRTTCI